MMDNQKPNRRIVSRNEYIIRGSRKLTLSVIGISLCGVSGAACITFACVFLFCLGVMGVEGFFTCTTLLAISCFVFFCGRKVIKQAEKIDTGIPLTRTNSTNLPAEESLVRPFHEPIETQQAVLLRAASQSDATPTGQLVRPVGGNE